MQLNEYQEAIKKYRLDSYTGPAAIFGLLAEAGEVSGVLQKTIRGDFDTDEMERRIKKELGDVLWHIAAVAEDNEWKLDDIATENLAKLEDRLQRNVIAGDGNDR